MKEFGLRRRFAGFMTVIILASASAAAMQALFVKKQRDDWYSLKEEVLAREQLLMLIRSQMGYGSLIHNFKNYVLRGQPDYYRQLSENHSAVAQGIKRYRQLSGLTVAEHNALDDIRQVADQYLASANVVRDLLARGADRVSIDKSVKISDGPAVQGLSQLQARNTELLAIYIQRLESRVDSVFGITLLLIVLSLAVVLFAGTLFYRSLTRWQRSLYDAPVSLLCGMAGEVRDEAGNVAAGGTQHVSGISLLSEETAAAVERNKAVIAELDHKALQ